MKEVIILNKKNKGLLAFFVLLTVVGGVSLFAKPMTIEKVKKELKDVNKWLDKIGRSEDSSGSKKAKKMPYPNKFKPRTKLLIGTGSAEPVSKVDTDKDGVVDTLDYYPSNPDASGRFKLRVNSVMDMGGSQAAVVRFIQEGNNKSSSDEYVKVGYRYPRSERGKERKPAVEIMKIDASKKTVWIRDIINGKKRGKRRKYKQKR